MAKFGIALGSGPRGLGFESRYSDHKPAFTSVDAGFLTLFKTGDSIMLKKIQNFMAKETVLCVAAA